MKATGWQGQLPRALCALLLGCALVLTWRAYAAEQARLGDAASALLARQEQLLQQREALDGRIVQLEETLAAYAEAGGDDPLAALQGELQQTQVLAGLTDMSGPGVEVVLNDAPDQAMQPGEDVNLYIVHDVDVLRVVSQLRNAGAECVAINGERLLSNSRIRCGGPTIRVRDQSFAPPFVIQAIGDPQALFAALSEREPGGGMSEVDILRFFGVQVDIRQMQQMTVPRYKGEITYRYAKAVE